jgi:hypothetical protein
MIEEAEFTDLAIVEKKLGITNNSFLDLRPLYDTTRPDNGKYRLDQKCEAVVMMQAYIDVNDMSLELEPEFSAVSEMLGYPVGTLKRWWNQKAQILETGRVYVKDLRDVHLLKLFTISQKIQEEMLDRGLKDVPFKDLAMALKTMTIVSRVVQDGSNNGGSSKTVNHNHRISFVKPGVEG